MYLIKEKIDTWYHGSEKEIRNWSTEFTGQGDDALGAGIYFTSVLEDAEGYTRKDSSSTSVHGVVHVVSLNTTRWLSMTKKPTKAEVEKFIKWAEDYEITLSNWNEDLDEALKECVSDYLKYNKTAFECFQSIEADFYRGDGKGYCSSLVALDYDGVMVKKGFLNAYHAVVWNPKIIKVQDVY